MNERPINPYPRKLFVFGNDTRLGNDIVELLESTPAGLNVKFFPDGERIPHQTETVRGCDVFLIFTSQNGPNIDRWLMDYLRFVRSVREGHPHRITVIIPKSPQQRADVGNYSLREPKMSDFYPDLLKAAGADYIIVCKLHNPASNTRNPPMDNVDTAFLIIHNIKERFQDLSKVAIAAGDMGGSKYARYIANKLGTPLVITDKERDPVTGKTKSIKVYTYGKISRKVDTVVFVDDLISTFGTLAGGADRLVKKYPWIINFCAMATHPDFGDSTFENIVNSRFQEIWVTDTVPVDTNFINKLAKQGKKVVVVSVAKLLAKVIDNVHDGNPISSLWK